MSALNQCTCDENPGQPCERHPMTPRPEGKMMSNTTDATKPCRNHPHHCPGCGKEIECGYVCCATCVPPGSLAPPPVAPGGEDDVSLEEIEAVFYRLPDFVRVKWSGVLNRLIALIRQQERVYHSVLIARARAEGEAKGRREALEFAWDHEAPGMDLMAEHTRQTWIAKGIAAMAEQEVLDRAALADDEGRGRNV